MISRNPKPKHRPRAAPKAIAGSWQLREAARRHGIVRRALVILRGGASLNSAHKRIGVPVANLWRYLRAFQRGGAAALVPAIGSGRKPDVQKLALASAAIRTIASLARRSNVLTACRAYAKRPGCTRKLARALWGRLPRSVRAAINAAVAALDKRRTPKPIHKRRAK